MNPEILDSMLSMSLLEVFAGAFFGALCFFVIYISVGIITRTERDE